MKLCWGKGKMNKLILTFVMFAMFLGGMGCVGKTKQEVYANVENVTVTIPKLENTYRFVFLSDLHIIADEQEASEEHKQTVLNRKNSMLNGLGQTADEYWPQLAKKINGYQPDMVFLGGDMLDFMSLSNITCLKKGLDIMESPYMYVRADHDIANWYNQELSQKKIEELGKTIDSNEEIFIHNFKEISILGINNSTSQITSEGLKKIEEFFRANKKPVIVLTHVPLQSIKNDELDKLSKEKWQDRSLIWGKNCYYNPDYNTQRFMELMYNESNNVAAILSGHLHFHYEGRVSNNTFQYVFKPAYEGNIAMITVTGKKIRKNK